MAYTPIAPVHDGALEEQSPGAPSSLSACFRASPAHDIAMVFGGRQSHSNSNFDVPLCPVGTPQRTGDAGPIAERWRFQGLHEGVLHQVADTTLLEYDDLALMKSTAPRLRERA